MTLRLVTDPAPEDLTPTEELGRAIETAEPLHDSPLLNSTAQRAVAAFVEMLESYRKAAS